MMQDPNMPNHHPDMMVEHRHIDGEIVDEAKVNVDSHHLVREVHHDEQEVDNWVLDERMKRMIMDLQRHWLTDYQQSREKLLVEMTEKLHQEFLSDQQKIRTELLTQFKDELDTTRAELEDKYRESLKLEISKLMEKHKRELTAAKKKQWQFTIAAGILLTAVWSASKDIGQRTKNSVGVKKDNNKGKDPQIRDKVDNRSTRLTVWCIFWRCVDCNRLKSIKPYALPIMEMRENSAAKMDIGMVADYAEDVDLIKEGNFYDDMVVIGEGEDHKYCSLPVSSISSFNKHDLYAARYRFGSSTDVSNDAKKSMKTPNVYVRHDRTWKFQKTTVVATCDENGQLLYHPDPFLPVPPSKSSPCTVKRMEYAARRIDNRKYRAQRSKVLLSDKLNSATCSKCHMRFFLPFRHFKNRITYQVPNNPYLLPVPRFRCPLCEENSALEM
ncbi:hypothetical protein DICVIV_02970 [Dictyocaulus viviparus]|uniref:Uncharacterized protein n=1 Tax=Dictyocaulus viviparus TaxID=29172 RepID=A0A0D8Y297_DICVI|nr:hypothetical protein DICVIV_02970 [Dictyocaulus viviparus]